MALPYGPVVRGMTLSWIITRIRAELDNLKSPRGKFVFANSPRLLAVHHLDPRQVVRPDSPCGVIRYERTVISNSLISGEQVRFYDKGTIVHAGTGTDQAALTGSHRGNNQYVLAITASGTVGIDGSYELRTKAWDGSAWGAESVVSSGAIPASGEIETDEGTMKFVFTVGESVVLGDTYSWETAAYIVSNVNARAVRQRMTVDIYVQFADEASIENGYDDQLLLLFTGRKYVVPIEPLSNEVVVVVQELKGINTRLFFSAPTDEDKKESYEMLISLDLEYRGEVDGTQPVVFTAEVSPLATTLTQNEPTVEEEI